MKNIVYFQCGKGEITPWLDCVESWNNSYDDYHYAFSNNNSDVKTSGNTESTIFHFNKMENKILFSKNTGHVEEGNFVLTKAFVQPDTKLNDLVTRGIDLNFVIEWLNNNQDKSIGFGTFSANGDSHTSIIETSIFYTRNPWPSGHVFDIINNEFIIADDNRLSSITWFYAYKIKNSSIYFIVFNPSIVALGSDLEFDTETERYRIMDTGVMSNLLLKPKMNKNIFLLEDNWYVAKREEFTFEVGGLAPFKLGLGENLDNNLIKVISDLNLEYLGNNKYKARFKKGQQSAYISIRMNTGNTTDWTFVGSKNRLIYNLKITKHYKEE